MGLYCRFGNRSQELNWLGQQRDGRGCSTGKEEGEQSSVGGSRPARKPPWGWSSARGRRSNEVNRCGMRLCVNPSGDSVFQGSCLVWMGFLFLWKRRKMLSVTSGMTWSVHTHTGEPRGQESASPQGSPELRLWVGARAGFQLVPEAPADGGDI